MYICLHMYIYICVYIYIRIYTEPETSTVGGRCDAFPLLGDRDQPHTLSTNSRPHTPNPNPQYSFPN